MEFELGFLGAGNMAEAIARAAIDKGVLAAGQMIASDPNAQRRELFEGLGMATTDQNSEAIRLSKQVLLAVKPQVVNQAAADLLAYGSEDQVIVSILAGITTQRLSSAIGRTSRIIRVMPNTPVQVGVGMAGVSLSTGAKPGDEALTMRLFSAAGEAVVVDETDIDAITAVSGSGPAYVFYLAEAMQEAARELGVSDHASLLVNQTIRGAAQLLVESELSAGELRRKVTSPGGTTEAAINHLEGNKSQDVIINAIKAAAERSVELGR